MIVLEGPDGAGKSTLCARICNDFGLKMGERGEKNRDLIYRCTREDTWRAMHTELTCDAPPLVWDRLGPWSDPIYAPYVDRKVAFSDMELRVVEQFVWTLGCPIIICLPPLDVVKENVANSHQIKATNEHIDAIYHRYTRLLGSKLYPILYNYTSNDNPYKPVANAIRYYLRVRKGRECFSSSTPATSV